MVLDYRAETGVAPDPKRWVVETFGVKKRFEVREGLPVGMGWGQEHWLVSSLIKYRKNTEWQEAVAGVDLKVARGEMLGLLGQNGAGKTTLIKCLSTLLRIDEGTAFVNGFNVATQPDEVRLSINLVGSGHWVAFDWGMTITQNLHFFGSLYGLTKAERKERIEYTLKLLELEKLANKTPRGLSSGERQRMLLAKGFMVRAPIFFMDEPTVGLDPSGAKNVRDFIRKELLGQSDRSGILTTHRLVEAEELCSQIAIMSQGKVVAQGTPLELKKLAGVSDVIEIRATGISDSSVKAINLMGGVKAAVLAPVGEEGVEDSLRVHCENADRIMGQVMDILNKQDAEIASAEPQEPTLEDAFIALTDGRLN